MAGRRTATSPGAALVVAFVTVLAGGAAAPLSAQEPATPPPPAGGSGHEGSRYLELLPDIGRIGAQVGAAAGPAWNPYGVALGWHVSAFIDLPLARNHAGRLSYEILLSLSGGQSGAFTITDPLAYVANLARGASPADALAGPPRAPYAVRRDVRTRLRLLDVSPFALKYTLTGLDRAGLRPYVAAGLDVSLVTTTELAQGAAVGATPADAALATGGRAPELDERGIPAGEGSLALGGHGAVGVEIRVSRGLSLNLDYRLALVDASRTQRTASAVLGFHW